MNTNSEFCSMKNQTQQNIHVASEIFVLILGGLTTSSLMFLGSFGILNLNVEVVLAPFVIISAGLLGYLMWNWIEKLKEFIKQTKKIHYFCTTLIL